MSPAPRHLILVESVKRPPAGSHRPEPVDLLWSKLLEEAEDANDREPNLAALDWLIATGEPPKCAFAWNKDPALGVICIQSEPRG